MIIDFHTHIVHPAVRENRQNFFFNEPGFKLLYESPKSKLAGAEEIIAAMDDQGVDRSVVFGFPWKNPETMKKNNDYVLESVHRHAHRLTGLCCVDPSHADAAKEVQRCLQSGCAGVGELAFYDKGIDAAALDMLEPVMTLCREKNRVALIHTNEPVGHAYPGKAPMTLVQIFNLVKRFPQNKIVLAHWGGGIFLYSLLKKEIRESLQNVWFDTAASPFLYDPEIYRIARDLIGVEKILFGTDYPLLSPARYFREFIAAGLSTDEISIICGKNAEKLLMPE